MIYQLLACIFYFGIVKCDGQLMNGNVLAQLNTTEFLVNQPGCQIPKLDLFSPTVREYYHREADLQCDQLTINNVDRPYPSLIIDDENYLYFNKSALPYHSSADIMCGYRSFDREPKPEDSVKYSQNATILESNFTKEKITDEFVEVNCVDKQTQNYVYKDYFAFLPTKEETEKRDSSQRIENSISPLIVGLDSLSRLQFHRHLPKTAAYLKNQMNAIEMLGYNKVAENTYPNLIPVLTGLSGDELEQVCVNPNHGVVDSCPLIWKEFHKRGFRTIFGEDAPDLTIFNLGAEGFNSQPTDYYLRPMYFEVEHNIGHDNIGCGFRCLGSRSSLSFILKYAFKTAKTFQNKKYFGFLWSCCCTHDSFNFPTQVDETLSKFLKDLVSEELLNNTVLLLMSDHGPRLKSDFLKTVQGQLEKRLPMLNFVFPPWFISKYTQAIANLKANTHKLTTHFDLHHTLYDFMNLTRIEDSSLESRYDEPSLPGRSLFLPVSPTRNCSSARIAPKFCACAKEMVRSGTVSTYVVTRLISVVILNCVIWSIL